YYWGSPTGEIITTPAPVAVSPTTVVVVPRRGLFGLPRRVLWGRAPVVVTSSVVTTPVVTETRVIEPAPVIERRMVQPPPVVEERVIPSAPVFERRYVAPLY